MIYYIWGTLQQQLSKKVSYNLWKNRFLVYFIILKSWQNQIMQKYLLLWVNFRCWQFHVRKIMKISSGLEFRSDILRKTAKLLKWTFSKNDSEFSQNWFSLRRGRNFRNVNKPRKSTQVRTRAEGHFFLSSISSIFTLFFIFFILLTYSNLT